MRSIKRQTGVTAIGWAIILALVGFFALLTLKMVPVYLEYFKVVSSLESLESENVSSPGEIRRLLENRFEIDYVTSISPRQVKINNKNNYFDVSAKYDARIHLFANIDVMLAFDKQVEVPRR